jgi:hypothetical protein
MSEPGDVIDQANDRAAALVDAQEAEIRYQAAHIPVGEPGICSRCDESSPRLVRGVCAPCRDKFKLP